MTRNAYDDNTTLWAPALNAQLNASNLELVKSGCDPTKGTGDWDVDVASGTIIAGQSTGEVSVSAQTVALTDPANDADMDSGESRIDLVTVNSSGTASATEGTAASNPSSPDIPAGEVLVAFVHVENGDGTIADSDLFDPRVLFGPTAYPFAEPDVENTAPIYGDGSDGSITRSSDGNENGVVTATDYTLESGNTRTGTSGFLVIKATNSINIDGTLDLNGQGGSGGAGGSSGDNTAQDGGTGGNADIFPTGSGGSGGSGATANAGTGGNGGDGDTTASPTRSELVTSLPMPVVRALAENVGTAGAGGGGGGEGLSDTNAASSGNGSNGSAAGGGGGGGTNNNTLADGGDGGAGGSGGGFVLLMAPDVTVGGTVQAAGTDGSDGSAANGSGGGGGGGGSGGVVALVTANLTENSPTYDSSAGAGGTGATATSGDGGDGAGGESGSTVKIQL